MACGGKTVNSSCTYCTNPKEKNGNQPIRNKPIMIAIVLAALTSRFRVELWLNFAVLRFMVMRVIPCATKIRTSGKKKHRHMTDML